MKKSSDTKNQLIIKEVIERIKNTPSIERSEEEIDAEPVAHIPYSVIQTWPIQVQKNFVNFRKAIAYCQCKKCRTLRLI